MKRLRLSLRFGSALLVVVSALAACLAVVTGSAGVATAQSVNGYSVEAVGSTKTVANVRSDLSDLAIDAQGRWVAVVNNYAIGDLTPSGSGYQMTARVGRLDSTTPNFDVEGIDHLEGNLYAVTREGRQTSELRIYEITRTAATLKQTYALPMPVAVNNKGAESVVVQKIAKGSSGTQYTLLTSTEGYSGAKPQLYSFTIQADRYSNFSSTATKNWGPVALDKNTDVTALEIDPKTGHLLALTENGANYINVYELGNGSVKSLERLAPEGPFTRMYQPEGLAFNPANSDQLMVVGERNEVLELRVKRSGTTNPTPTPPVVNPGQTSATVAQDCYVYGDEASPSFAGTAIQRHVTTITNGTNQTQAYQINAYRNVNYRPPGTYSSAVANWSVQVQPGETRSFPITGFYPGEAVRTLLEQNGKNEFLDDSPGITCSVPMQQKGTRRVPAPREETLGVRIGQECVGDDVDRIYPIITNTTSSTNSYVVEWNWPSYGNSYIPMFQWSTENKLPGATYTAQNFFESGNKTRQRIVLKPGESTPPGSIVQEGRMSAGTIGIRVLRDSSVSNWSLGYHNLSSPVNGQEIFKAAVIAGPCRDSRAEVVQVVQECQYKLKKDTAATASSSPETRLRVNITNAERYGSGIYTTKFFDDTTNRLLATEQLSIKAGTPGTVTLAGRKDGERIRIEVDRPLAHQTDNSFVTKVDACISAYDH